jgi:hypothetical protein
MIGRIVSGLVSRLRAAEASALRVTTVLALMALAAGMATAQPPNGPPPPDPKRSIHFPPPPDPLTQEYVANKFIYSLIAGQVDTLRPLFDPEVRPYVTDELAERLRGQVSWLYNMIQGEFEEFASGGNDSSFFREYRLANESNKRAPLILVKVVFPDSVKTTLIGAQVKNFLSGNEKRLAGEQSWTIEGKTFDLHSVVLVKIDSGHVLAVQYYNDPPDSLTQESVLRIGAPLLREAVARGYVDSARAAIGGERLMERMGVVFMRKDPVEGFAHIPIGFDPEDFGGIPEAGTPKKGQTKTKATPAKKSPAKKK